jgi:hypothetical protein
LREALFVFGIPRLQAVRLAFDGIFGGRLQLGLGLRLRVGFGRMSRAAGEEKSGQNDQRTMHGLPHIQTEASLIIHRRRFARPAIQDLRSKTCDPRLAIQDLRYKTCDPRAAVDLAMLLRWRVS